MKDTAMTKQPPKLHAVGADNNTLTVPGDAADIEALWLDPALGDGIVDVTYHSIAIGKPKDFFRTHPAKEYRRRTELYTHKPEGLIDEQHYIVAPAMKGQIPEGGRAPWSRSFIATVVAHQVSKR